MNVECSNVPMFQCPLDHWTIGPLDHWSIGRLVHWTIGPLVHWSIALVWCQMSKVNKVKLLSERTSGVPPVIFFIYKEQYEEHYWFPFVGVSLVTFHISLISRPNSGWLNVQNSGIGNPKQQRMCFVF